MYKKNRLTKVDQKIMFGLVSKNPHKYVENLEEKITLEKTGKTKEVTAETKRKSQN